LAPNDVAFRRIMNTPSRGIGDTTLEKLALFAKSHKGSFIEASRRWKEAGIHDKAGEGLDSLHNILKALPPVLLNGVGTPGSRLVQFFTDIGYKAEVLASGAQAGAGEKKWQIVEVVANILDSYLSKRKLDRDNLREFLDSMTLRDDDKDDGQTDEVSLMTLHASKGLEFPFVILSGIEEDLLPHRSLGSDHDEERRLFYVGITRAKRRLTLTRCQTRKRHGTQKAVAPSRFLLDLPGGLFLERQGPFRPVNADERQDLVGGLLAKLQSRHPVKPGRAPHQQSTDSSEEDGI